MTLSRITFFATAVALSTASAAASGESDFRFSSDLIAAGFEPVAVSATANATYGLFKAPDLYLCFLADNSDAQKRRVSVIGANLSGEAEDATVPNIPVVCVLTE